MFRNFLKSAFRNSLRNKAYTLINMLGLAIGLSVFLLLLFYIRHEQSFNMYNSKAGRIYRIVENAGSSDVAESKTIFTNWAMAGALKQQFPEVEEVARVFLIGSALNTIGENKFLERNYYVTEKSYFSVFDHTFVAGDLSRDVGSNGADIVLSESAARRYFGNDNPIDQLVSTNSFGNCRVAAVYKDMPRTSSFSPDFVYLTDVRMWSENAQKRFASWETRNCGAYVLMKENAGTATLVAGKESLLKANLGEKWETRNFELQPLEDVHLKSVDINTPTQNAKGNQQYIVIFGLIAVFVLVIAIVNYINLATARAIFRRREVGIRKVVGASKSQLISQFLIESVIISTIALVISLCLIELMLPWFNSMTERSISIPYVEKPQILAFLFAISLFTGLISGIVPAFIISSYQPGEVLHGHAFHKVGNLITRKVLVVFQFSLSIIMIVATLVVYRQMEFVQNRDMGFEKERKLVIDINYREVRANFKAMKGEFLAHSDVRSVAAVSRVPGEWKNIETVAVTQLAGEEPVEMSMMGFDADALSTFDISLKTGEGFTGNDQVDSLQVLINEKAASMLGGEAIVGQKVRVKYGEDEFTFQVKGIVEDFNFESLYQEIGPMVIGSWNNGVTYIDYFVLSTIGDPAKVLAHADAVHRKFAPEGTIEYNFLDQQWERYYKDDVKRGSVFALSAGLAIVIACLGLFGLASFSTSLRVKEFGVRKVLGATDRHLVLLITREFLVLVLTGFAIASPLAYWLMSKWLSTYAYNAGISFNIFLATGITVVVVALLTVGYKSLSAARQNPVNALRN